MEQMLVKQVINLYKNTQYKFQMRRHVDPKQPNKGTSHSISKDRVNV